MNKKVYVVTTALALLMIVIVLYIFFNHDKKSIAEGYVTDLGYKITEHLVEEQRSYILKEDMIRSRPFNDIWSLQHINPEELVGKEIVVEKFQVSNHPFEDAFAKARSSSSSNIANENNFFVEVFLCDNEVIGGISYPLRADGVMYFGGVYPIDWRALEAYLDFSEENKEIN